MFYKLCAEKTFEDINFLELYNKYIYYSEEEDKAKVAKWTKHRFLYSLQKGNDLGERMYNAFEAVLNYNNQKALIIGIITLVCWVSRDLMETNFH